MERQNLVETEPQPTQEWQDARRAVEPILYLQDEAWPLDPSQGFWINYTKRVVQYMILLAGESRSGILVAARRAQPRGMVALYQQWLDYHEWGQLSFVIPHEVLLVGVLLQSLPQAAEHVEINEKWNMVEAGLCRHKGRIPTVLGLSLIHISEPTRPY